MTELMWVGTKTPVNAEEELLAAEAEEQTTAAAAAAAGSSGGPCPFETAASETEGARGLGSPHAGLALVKDRQQITIRTWWEEADRPH
jgi:hypothetical protein